MTLREISYRLMDLYRNSSGNKDADNIDLRHLVSFVNTMRSKFIKQRMEKGMYFPDETVLQTLVAEEFTLIKSNTYNLTVDGISISDMGRDVLASVRTIPKTISKNNGYGTWSRVSPSDMLNVRINMSNIEKAIVSGYGKFNYNEIYGFEYNGKIYITCKNPTILETVSRLDMRGLFESPLEVMALQNPNLIEEELWDLPYPIDISIIDDIEKSIIMDKLQIPMEAKTQEFPKE